MLFHQVHGYELGNFITITPALREYYRVYGSCHVFFDTKEIESLYINCPFMNICKSITKDQFKIISNEKEWNGQNEYEMWFDKLGLQKPESIEPYIDKVEVSKRSKSIALIHGCLSDEPERIDLKDVGVEIRQRWLDQYKDYDCYIIGTLKDYEKFWQYNKIPSYVQNCCGHFNLRDAVTLLGSMEQFISNDTGLYHVAAALQIPGQVYWKKSFMKRMRAPFNGIKHIQLT